MYDLVIVGGGPAGVAAGVYAARKKLKTVLIAGSFGGQSLVSAEIQNWIGAKSISGLELAKNLEEHLRAQKEVELDEGDLVEKMDKTNSGFRIATKKGKIFETKTVLICSGSRRKRLGIPGENEFDGKGVVWCSVCDAPLFKDKIVAVAGAGNAGLEAVRDLLSYAKKIYLLIRSESVKGDPMTFEEIKNNPRAEIIFNAEIKEIFGRELVTGIRYLDKGASRDLSGQEKQLAVSGVFVEIGSIPNSEFVKDLVRLDKWNQIIVDGKTQAASLPGIWAAGDVTDLPYRQNNISAGDAIKAVLNIHDYLGRNSKN